MKPAALEPRISTRRKVAFYAAYLLFISLIFLLGAEIILRAKGIMRRYRTGRRRSESNSTADSWPGSPWSGGHTSLEHTITLDTGYRFRFTILPDKHRITRPLADYSTQDAREKIWIFGCSYTEGWSLNDEETYPWLLQERFPDYDELANFGVELRHG
ncbi:MAG: hypothetical protein U1F14_15795 [Steroidobacteraceae bacterium]